jgi:Zn-dependent peptidase ImmA (M78 family)
MNFNYETLKNKAKVFLYHFYQSKNKLPVFPILLSEMAAYLHYTVTYTELPEYMIAYTDMVKKQIYLTTTISEMENINNRGRINFTIAHEIAHIVLHEKMYLKKLACCAQDNDWETLGKMTENEQYEKEADFFASHIILPRELLKKEIADYFGKTELYFSGINLQPDISLSIIAYLKEKTKASENAIIIALRDLKIIQN